MKNSLIKTIFAMAINLALILSSGTLAFARPVSPLLEQTEIDSAISMGIDYLQTQMNADGGIRWFDENSSVDATIRSVQALAATDLNQNYLQSETGNSPIDYLAESATAWVNQADSENPGFSVGRAGQLLTAIAAANENPRRFGAEGIDWITEINRYYDRSTGVYSAASPENVIDQVWALIGLAANNAAIPLEATGWLVSAQLENGSWNDGFGGFLDTTPLAILALVASGHYSSEASEIQSAIMFMSKNQQPDGGWQAEWDSTTNAKTTGMMLQAIAILGQSPEEDPWQKETGNPLTALLSVQQDSGAFGGEFANAFSTADAITGLKNDAITDLGYLELASDSFDFVFSQQDESGGWGSVGQTVDVLLALAAAGWAPNSVTIEGAAPLNYISANLEDYLQAGPDAIGKLILGLTASGANPTDFGNTNLVNRLMDAYDEDAGAFGSPDNTWHQAFAILGLNAASQEIPEETVQTLISLQQRDGGWAYSAGAETRPDNASLAIQALIAAGFSPDHQVITKALDFIESAQIPSGGWGDSSTAAYVLMAIQALGQSRDDWITASGKDPLGHLLSYQKPNGAFVYNSEFPDDSLMSTVSALLALFNGNYLITNSNRPSRSYAAIFVIPGEGSQYDCVGFEEPAINGLTLLDRSIFEYNTQDGFISHIDAVGNREGETNYWSYWSWNGREWVFKNSSAGDSQVIPGAIEAWYFTSWDIFPSLPPDVVPDFHQICGVDALKAYDAQPYLNYNDLFEVPLQQVSTASETQADSTPTEDFTAPETVQTSTPEKEPMEPAIDPTTIANQDERPSPLPLFLIAGLGALALILVYLILRKKRQ